jgi:hypothetical protein
LRKSDHVESEQEAAELPDEEISLTGINVLIAEDMELNAEILMDLLEIEEITSEWAKNGEAAVEMFEEIIELKRKYPERITLLVGNHDCGYAVGPKVCEVRRDNRNARKICKLFDDNWELFKLADEARIADKHFIFTHAGINKTYAERCFDDVNEDNVVSLFNEAWLENNWGIMDSLGQYSDFRGWGGGDYGSLVWADAREWFQEQYMSDVKNEAYGYAVVGHTHINKAHFEENMAFIDTADAYYIDSNGDIKKYYDNEEEETNDE